MIKIKGVIKLIGRPANQIIRLVSNKLSDSVNTESSNYTFKLHEPFDIEAVQKNDSASFLLTDSVSMCHSEQVTCTFQSFMSWFF